MYILLRFANKSGTAIGRGRGFLNGSNPTDPAPIYHPIASQNLDLRADGYCTVCAVPTRPQSRFKPEGLAQRWHNLRTLFVAKPQEIKATGHTRKAASQSPRTILFKLGSEENRGHESDLRSGMSVNQPIDSN